LHLITLNGKHKRSRTPLDEGSARRRAGFKHTIPAIERPQNHASDGAAIGIGVSTFVQRNYSKLQNEF